MTNLISNNKQMLRIRICFIHIFDVYSLYFCVYGMYRYQRHMQTHERLVAIDHVTFWNP